jgi:2',3'-cyclic-nucleotide 2'-phosphodiesterase (5'-nucleotidase family)
MVNAKGELFARKPYVILKVNGLRVGVIGAMTDDLPTLTIPKLVAPWHTLPLLETVKKYALEIKGQTDLIVLLAHITTKEELQVLQAASDIPVVVTGHAHNGIAQALTQDGRILVRVKGYAEELGKLQLKVDTEKKSVVSYEWKAITVDSTSTPAAPDVAAMVKHWEDEVSARVDQPLATSMRAFDKRGVKALMEQAMREMTGADFAFMNAGGVRDILPKGRILVRNIWNIMPFDNRVVFGKFKGRDLPAAVVGDRKVDPDKEYTLAVSDFTAANQGSNENLRVTGLEFPGDGGLLRDVLVDWFRKKKVIE